MESESCCRPPAPSPVPEQPTRVLLVEDDPDDARLLEDLLRQGRDDAAVRVTRAGTLRQAFALIDARVFDVVLLDLGLPDGQGIETFLRLQTRTLALPVIICTGPEEEQLGVEAVRKGAQDSLAKEKMDAGQLSRAIAFAIERHKRQLDLQHMALTDPLTGLMSRQGFFLLARQQIALADRSGRGMCLLFGDLDGLKAINDNLGHAAGDQALKEIAQILLRSFRTSDIIARFGGDEFVVLCLDFCSEAADQIICRRLDRNLKAWNSGAGAGFPLEISFGLASYRPDSPCSLEDLLESADRLMYEQKRKKKEHLWTSPGGKEAVGWAGGRPN